MHYNKIITQQAACLIQANHTDLSAFPQIIQDPAISIIHKAKQKFHKIILVCGDTKENEILAELTEKNGISIFKGDNLNVLKRFLDCMEYHHISFAVRILSYRFTVDFDYVLSCLYNLSVNEADYAVMPHTLDEKFTGDVFNISFLRKATSLLKKHHKLRNNYRSYLFSPWSLTESHPEFFSLTAAPKPPSYNDSVYEHIHDIVNRYYPERVPITDLHAYSFAASFIPVHSKHVADISCGDGGGTVFLAKKFHQVSGVDYDQKLIEQNQLNNTQKNASFVHGNTIKQELFPENYFDSIISIHSMEHYPDDNQFLANCSYWLKPGGLLILEVPLLMQYLFPSIGKPLGDAHFREYNFPSLKQQCSRWFEISKEFGVTRGLYLAIEKRWNAVLLCLKNKKRSDI